MTGSYAGDKAGGEPSTIVKSRKRMAKVCEFLSNAGWATVRVNSKGCTEFRIMPTLLTSYEYSQFISWCQDREYIEATGNAHWPFLFLWDESPLGE